MKTKINFDLKFYLKITLFIFVFFAIPTHAQYGLACSEYGVMAYEDYSGYCKCLSGYVFQDDGISGTRCVNANLVCTDKYGYGARYDSLSGSCECSYGYVFGKDSIGRTQCITDDKSCQNQLGYNSSATYGGQCKCNYGYVIENGQCVDGDMVCKSDHGYNSSYDDLNNKCECDNGYTLDDKKQCVEKHNSAYFKLLDIDIDREFILVESQHDYQKYILGYGIGCWDYALESYEGQNLVINMGTDFIVDFFDTIVLQNHNQTCSIMDVDWTTEEEFEVEEESVYIPPISVNTPNVIEPEPTPKIETRSIELTRGIETNSDKTDNKGNNDAKINQPTSAESTLESQATSSKNTPSKEPLSKKYNWITRFFSWFF